mmetsp:Transcript_158361/g.507922  ORF Transcript_158361/g.507922 Transcript_158361/m.507922 type:complete len:135 (+) Transcript_158361:961-1365(+)
MKYVSRGAASKNLSHRLGHATSALVKNIKATLGFRGESSSLDRSIEDLATTRMTNRLKMSWSRRDRVVINSSLRASKTCSDPVWCNPKASLVINVPVLEFENGLRRILPFPFDLEHSHIGLEGMGLHNKDFIKK